MKRVHYLVLIFSFLFIGLVASAATYRINGPVLLFSPPEAITATDGTKFEEREVRFLNFLPTRWSEHTSADPLFETGDVVQIINPQLHMSVGYTLRVEDPIDLALVGGRDVHATYFIHILHGVDAIGDKDVIHVRITAVNRVDALRQNDTSGEWFWLREFYEGEVLN